MKKVFLIVFGFFGILLLIILVANFAFFTNKDTKAIPPSEEMTSTPSQAISPSVSIPAERVTVKGEVICLPHKNPGDGITLECAFGLKGDDGKNYGLKYTDPESPWMVDTGKRIEVSGNLVPDEQGIYDVVGNIEIETVTPLSEK
ncbi:MAG: hypothetical protein ACOX50_02350 [Patescibacteria group bacterium]|jgi:hypothetical protein